MPALLTLGLLVLVAFALALLPTRRLSALGWRPGALLVYLLAMIGLGVAAIELRGLGRVLIPLALVLLVAPFVLPSRWLVRLGGSAGLAARDITPQVRIITPELEPGGAPPPEGGDSSGPGMTEPEDDVTSEALRTRDER